MNRLRISVLALLLTASAVSANAQLTPERIARDKYIVNGVAHAYRPADTSDTPAPKGYKPFYISHVGRHGSRFELGDGDCYQTVSSALVQAREAGILKEQGEAMLKDIQTMMAKADGMYEMLTQRGGTEHRGIADRMMSRFPAVFASRTRNQVDAVSSTVQRCIVSMSNFLLEVGRKNPAMHISMDTGDKYMRYLMRWDGPAHSAQVTVGPDSDAFLKENLDVSRIYSSLFTDSAKAETICNPYTFCKELFTCMAFTETMELEGEVDLYRFLQPDELFALAADHSDRFYASHANSTLYGDAISRQASNLLADVIAKADAALLPGSERAADLRFTHDTAILPFACLVGLSDVSIRLEQTQAHNYWAAGDNIPMGTNFQMVFYSSRKSGEVLVKILYNEKERSITGLKAVSGPYYRWTDLRAYLQSLVQKDLGSR